MVLFLATPFVRLVPASSISTSSCGPPTTVISRGKDVRIQIDVGYAEQVFYHVAIHRRLKVWGHVEHPLWNTLRGKQPILCHHRLSLFDLLTHRHLSKLLQEVEGCKTFRPGEDFSCLLQVGMRP